MAIFSPQLSKMGSSYKYLRKLISIKILPPPRCDLSSCVEMLMFRSNFIFRFMHPNNVKNRLLRITFVQFNIMKKLRITALIFILIIPFALVGCGKKASIQGTLNNILKNDWKAVFLLKTHLWQLWAKNSQFSVNF